jgi:type VI secretion system secreted protein Hcp
MATNMYIKFVNEAGTAIKGEAEDDKHKEWVEVLSWSHGFSQPASPIRSSTGSTIERANHSDFSITKYLDSATDDLLKACWSGDQFKSVDLECFRADGDNAPIKYLEVNMEDVIVSNVNLSGGGGDIPIENISLGYSKVTYKYDSKKKSDAKAAGVQPVSHDLKINKVE